jgi:Bacterial Ig-like domain (group 3)
VRKDRFLFRVLSGAFVVAVVAGGVLLTGRVSDAASPAGSPRLMAATTSATTTTLNVSATSVTDSTPVTVTYGTPVMLTATITPAVAGKVRFKDGDNNYLGESMPDSNGKASMSISTLTGGEYSLTAVFTPTDQVANGTSTSEPVALVVVPQPTTLTKPTSSIGILPFPGVEVAAKLTTTDGVPVSERMIEFYGGDQLLCRQLTDSDGLARCSAAENFGTQTVNEVLVGYKAKFSGDEKYGPSAQHASATIGTGHSEP